MMNKSAKLLIVEDDDFREEPLTGRGQFTVGRAGGRADIPLNSLYVSHEQGSLRNVEGYWFYTDDPQNRNQTRYNGAVISRPMKRLRQPIAIHSGDVLRVDSAPWQERSGEGSVLLFLEEENIPPLRLTVLPQRDLPLGHGAALRFLNGGYYVTGKAVRMGGEPLPEPTLLREGDRFSAEKRQWFYLGEYLIGTT